MMNEKQIDSALTASKIIQCVYIWRLLELSPGYFNRNGSHVRLIDQNTSTIFHVKFANEPFKKFGEYYPEFRNEDGESINKDAIIDLKDNDIIFFCRPNNINRMFVDDFLRESYIRTTLSNEVVYSIPIKKLDILI